MRRTLALLPALAFLSAFLHAAAPPVTAFAVIVNPSNTVISLTRAELSRIFLKKVTRWKDNGPMVPVDLEDGVPVRRAFSRAIHGRDVPAIKNYWQQQIFSGRGVPPRELDSEEEVVRFVARIPGAVGYVSKGTPLKDVRILKIGD